MSVFELIGEAIRPDKDYGHDSPHLPENKNYEVKVLTCKAEAEDVYDLDSRLALISNMAETLGVVIEFDSDNAVEV